MALEEALAAQAVRDLAEFSALAQRETGAAEALKHCLELGNPVIVAYGDIVTAGATNPVIKLKLNETLMAHLSAFRARKREHLNC